VASAGPYANHFAPRSRQNHASTSTLLQAGCPSCRLTNSVKALKALQRHLGKRKNLL